MSLPIYEPKSDFEKKLTAEARDMPVPSNIPKDWYDLRIWVEFDLSKSLEDQISFATDNLQKAAKQAERFMKSLFMTSTLNIADGEILDATSGRRESLPIRLRIH